MRTRFNILPVLLAVVLAWTAQSPAAVHAAGAAAASPCTGDTVAGRVVAVDEATGAVTIDTGNGQCVVTLAEPATRHPIAILLGKFFGTVNVDSLAEALNATQGCALHDQSSGEWVWADCSVLGAVPVTLLAKNPDGTFEGHLDAPDTTVPVLVEDDGAAGRLGQALDVLMVEWRLGEAGAAIPAADQIAAYHSEGMGFGVLVKLYGIALASQQACAEQAAFDPACGVTVDELVSAFRSGTGIGQLFHQYGRPAFLGVGHVRQQVGDEAGDEMAEPGSPGARGHGHLPGGSDHHGICNARAHGGNAFAWGQGEIACP